MHLKVAIIVFAIGIAIYLNSLIKEWSAKKTIKNIKQAQARILGSLEYPDGTTSLLAELIDGDFKSICLLRPTKMDVSKYLEDEEELVDVFYIRSPMGINAAIQKEELDIPKSNDAPKIMCIMCMAAAVVLCIF